LRSQLKREFSGTVSKDSSGEVPSGPFSSVFVDGVYRPELSSLADMAVGVDVVSLRDVGDMPPAWIEDHLSRTLDDDDRALIALNTALFEDGIFIRVREGVVVDGPIHLYYETTSEGLQAHTRTIFVLERNARATFVETFSNSAADGSFTNAMTTLDLGEGAELYHYKHQREGENVVHVQTIHAVLHAHAKIDSFYLTTGTGFSRTDGVYNLLGEGGDISVNGAYLLSGTQHGDISTEIIHGEPNCTSREIFHGVLLDNARGIFQGRILVARNAQKTVGNQMNRVLLLSERAKADSKPELEIHADDIKCSHGMTAGELDKDALFYLRSRGLTLLDAKALLAEAFINEAVDKIQDEGVKSSFKQAASKWIAETDSFAVEGRR
jgi:Fe-S cluster assembly protein SufD